MSAPFPVNDSRAPQPLARRLKLGRAARLTKNREFSRLRQVGERVVQGCLIANWQKLPPGGRAKLGVVTSKKIGGAVERARARRLLRESFRLHQHDLAQPMDIVLVARNSIAGKSFFEVEKDYLTALKRAGLRKPSDS